MECASEPDGLAAGAGALPGARRRCEAGKRTHGPGQRACLAAAALLALAAPAQAQTEVWSATLTPQDTGNGALGCDSTESNTAAQCSNTAVLSDNDFTLGSTDHTIGIIELAGESLQITSTGVFTDADTLALVLGTTSLAFSRGVTIQGGAGRVWPSTGLSWTAGTDVSVRLISLTAPGAPTGLAATANGPSRIDLSWTAPVNTGGSAITGYKIEVSPDGSSWSDLDTDTESTDTAYAHMEARPRHHPPLPRLRHQRRGHLRRLRQRRHHHRLHQHRGDGRADHHGHGAGGPDADGGHHRHRGRQRADQPRIHVPVDPGERHGGRHCGREFEHLHPGRRRQEENQ